MRRPTMPSRILLISQKLKKCLTEQGLRICTERWNIFLKRFCPIPDNWSLSYNYIISQAEYACDVLFKNEEALKP